MPPGMRHGYQFAFCNAINFQIATGTPVILYAKSLGASATVLGILSALLSLFTFLQLFAGGYLAKFGYRKFMLGGWGLRTTMVFALSVVPLLSFIDAPTKVALVLLLLVVFAIMRGIAMGVWLPWITELLPVNQRGAYLSREQMSVHSGSLAALGFSAITLQFLPHPARYSVVFLLSAFAGVTSLFALRKMPDAEMGNAVSTSSHPVPWKAIVQFPPFQKLLLFTGFWCVATSSLGTFTVAYTRESLHFPESRIIYLSLCTFAGALATLPFTARLLHQVGAKNALRLSTFLTAVTVAGWLGLAANILPGTWWMVALLNGLFGMTTSNFAVANATLAMGVMPPMGRNHFFALFTVTTSALTGFAPIFFGILLDAFRQTAGQIGAWSVNHYSLYFLLIAALILVTTLLVSVLHEHELGKLNRRDFAIFGSLRRLGRLFGR